MSLMSKRFLLHPVLVLSSVLVLSACSSIDFGVGDRIDYKNSKTINSLEVPPDLHAPDYDPTFATIPSGSVSASALARGEVRSGSGAVLPTTGGVQMMSSGNVRWLQVAAPADAFLIRRSKEKRLQTEVCSLCFLWDFMWYKIPKLA